MSKFTPRVILNYYFDLILGSKKWLLVILLFFVPAFLGGFLVAFYFPQIAAETISKYAQSIDTEVKSGFEQSFYIFRRNLVISLIAVLGGVVIGVIPVFITYVNGFFLGVIIGFQEIYSTINLWQLLLLLAPHGIIEYLATFLAWGFGLRLGITWLLPKASGKRLLTLATNLKETLFILVLVVVLLAIAAFIEGYLTLEIACFLGGICQKN